MRALRTLLAVLAVGTLSFSVTACGDDDGGSSPLANAGDSSTDSGDTPDDSADSGDDLDLPSDDELDDLSDLTGLDEACFGGAYVSLGMLGLTDESTAKEAMAYFDDARDDLPDDIRDDFDVLAEAFKVYGEVLADHDYDFMKLAQDEDAQAALEIFDSSEFNEASENVNQWFEENCDASN